MGVVTASIVQVKTGKLIEPDYELLSIDIRREYNRVPYAELVYNDGDPATQKFPLTDSDFFAAGTEIEIRLRYERDNVGDMTVFKGVVIRQNIQLRSDGCILTVELSDPAVQMTASRKSMVYENTKDSDILSELITANGQKPGTIAATNVTHKRLVQYYTSDWDFMLCRAEANGLIVSVTDGIIGAVAPDLGQGTVHTFRFGIDPIYSFDIDADSRHQHAAVQSSSWDVKTQKFTAPVSGEAFTLPQQKLNDSGVLDVLGKSTENLIAGVAFSDNEAKAWADSRLLKDRMALLRGSMRLEGKAIYNIGDIADLQGMSGLFTGKTLITGIHHEVGVHGWYTDLQFGLSAEQFSARYPVTDTPAAGLLPGVNGLQIGIVEELVDPDNEFRVKVKVPALGADKNAIWARLALPDAGKEHGMFFYPEPGDEVILGFLNDDPRQAILIGSVYSSAFPAAFTPDKENPIKGLVTKSGMKLVFDDAKKTLTVSTSDSQQVVINEEKKTLELKDGNENSILMSSDGITFTSAKDLVLTASGDVKIDATGKVEIKGAETNVI